MMRMSSPSNLEAFVQAVRLKSFSSAARRRGQTPSAVARQVSSLETEVGVRLLLRSTRSLELTDAGRKFYARAVDILEQIAEAKRETTATSKQVRGTVRLSCWPTLGKHLVLPSLPDLMSRFPDLAVDLDLSEMVHEPVLAQKELCIRVGKQQDTSMVQTKVGIHRSLIVASPAYLARHGEPSSLDECLQHRLIDKRHPTRLMGWDCLLNPKRLMNAARVITTDDLQAQSDACTSGIGIAHLPSWAVRERLDSGALVAVLKGKETVSAPVFLVRAQGAAPAAVRALASHLTEHLRNVLV